MEILRPSSYHHNTIISNISQNSYTNNIETTKWTNEENKTFEDLLAIFDEKTPDRWQRVAQQLPGKTVADVIKQYKELVDDVTYIEAGLYPVPGYQTCQNNNINSNGNGNYGYNGGGNFFGGFETGFKVFNDGFGSNKRMKPMDHERKKGVPWTEKEHKLFLLGLRKYGKGDWRNISRNYVITRTSTQVASHAQKYFHRQLTGGKDKRRASIHDITTVNLDESQPHSFTENQNPPSVLSPHTKTILGPRYQWSDRSSNAMELGSHPANQNLFMSAYNAMNPNGSFDYVAAKNMGFQMNSARLYPHG